MPRGPRHARTGVLAFAAAVVCVAVIGTVVVIDPGSHHRTFVEVAPSSTTTHGRTPPARACPATSLVVTGTSNETLTPTWLPAGFVFNSGNPHDLGSRGDLTYSPPGGGDPPRVELLRYRTTAPLATLSAGMTHQAVAVQGHVGDFATGGASWAFTSVAWAPMPGIALVVVGYKMDEPTLLHVADGVTYKPGTTFTYPAHPHIRLSRADALAVIHDTTADGRAVLTSAGELDAVTNPNGPVAEAGEILSTVPVTTPVWVVWDAPSTGQFRTAVVVDASSGARLTTDLALAKISSLTDRSGSVCAPPFGVLTRSEVERIRPAQPGTRQTAILTTFGRFRATRTGFGFAQCGLDSCDPNVPVWVLISTAPDQRFVDEEQGLGRVRRRGARAGSCSRSTPAPARSRPASTTVRRSGRAPRPPISCASATSRNPDCCTPSRSIRGARLPPCGSGPRSASRSRCCSRSWRRRSCPRSPATNMRARPSSTRPRSPTLLTVDDVAAPLAVEGAPQFGWVTNDPDRGEIQTAYELVVGEVPVGGGASRQIWHSGEVKSEQESYVTAPGLVLQPDRAYTWAVRTWDRTGRVGPFASGRFDVGLLDGDWHADWIRRPGAPATPVEDYSLIRKQFVVGPSPIVRARAYMSAGQQYDLRVNGVRAAHGPSFAYPDEQYYEATDITTLLHAGARNAIGVVTHWSTPGQGRPASVPAFIARITIDHADGTRQVIVSNGTWRTHKGPWIQGGPRNDEGDFIEHIDGRLEPVGWDTARFDDLAWPRAQVLGPHPTAPFLHLYAAAHAHRREPGEARDVQEAGRRRVRGRLRRGDRGDAVDPAPRGGRGPRGVGDRRLPPRRQRSRVQDARHPADRHALVLRRARGPADLPTVRVPRLPLPRDRRRGRAAHRGRRDLAPCHADMPDEDAASFKTSNPAIDAVWNLARHSALYASQEQFIDTPTREKGAFMDPYDSAVTMAAFDDRALTFEALRDFARSQKRYWPDGRVNVVYPNGDGKRDIPDSTEQYVQWVWQVYQTTGDRVQAASLYLVVKNISDYVNRAINADTGLVTNLPGGGSDYLYGLVDWPPQMRYGYDMATVAWHDGEHLRGRRVRPRRRARRCARPPEARAANRARARRAPHGRDRGEAAQARRGVRRRARGRRRGRASTRSQIANVYALAFGLVPAAQEKAVADYIVSLRNQIGVSTFSYLLDALHAAGRDDAFVAAITDPTRPGYADILEEGATYTWESWDARQTGDSESHGFGSTVLFTLQNDILGVRTAAPGASTVEISTPALAHMSASGVVVTQRGRIPISWHRGAPGTFSLDVTIPDNVVATIDVPAASVADVSDGRHKLTDDAGVRSVHEEHGEVVLTVGSGLYELHEPARFPRPANSFPWTVLVFGVVGVFAFAQLAVMRRRRQRAA